MIIILTVVFVVIGVILTIIAIIGTWLMFEKADERGWACLVPIYNACVLSRIAGRPTWWGLLLGINIVSEYEIQDYLYRIVVALVGIASVVLYFIVSIGIAKKFGKNIIFGIGLFFMPFVFYPILGFGESKYQGVDVNGRWICKKCGNNNSADHIRCWQCGNDEK